MTTRAYVRVKPDAVREDLFLCGFLFLKTSWKPVDVDDATLLRLRTDFTLEVSLTDPGSGVGDGAPIAGYKALATVLVDSITNRAKTLMYLGRDLLADLGVAFAKTDQVTGGVGIIGPEGKQIGGTASPYAFTTRALAETDNGQTRICASAQTATVDASMPVGFGVAFKGAISFTAGDGVTIADVRTTGAANPWCALTQTGVDTYDVVGTKA